jgi:hypothetical protein
MPRYNAKLLQAPVSTAFKSVGALWATSAVRARRMALYDATLSQTGGLSSTDCQIEYDFTRFSTTSLIAGTAFTPSPIDAADDGTLGIYLNNVSTEVVGGALGAAGLGLNLYTMAENQRATFRWRALETYDMMIIPAAAFNGITFRTLSSNFNSSQIGVLSYLE